jgi:acyl-CoA synthetase (AMP-forming)/AMP-acid ligase II
MFAVDVMDSCNVANLDDLLQMRAKEQPDAESIIFAQDSANVTTVGFAELNALAEDIARGLWDHGVSRGDRVGIVLEDKVLVFAAVYAVWRVGAVVVPFDPRWGPESCRGILDSARVACILGETLSSGLTEAAPAAPFLQLPRLAERGRSAEALADRGAEADALAILAYTSGTTGAA